jgi:acetyl-CoA carboxylase alpha subunit
MLKLTSQDLLRMRIVDYVVPEPPGGSHTNPQQAAELLRPILNTRLQALEELPREDLLRRRHEKIRKLATFVTGG